MSKYEAMVVVDGSLSEPEAKTIFTAIKKNLSETSDLKVTEMGHRKLAYMIEKKETGYYYVLNFTCVDAAIIAEFRRLILLNKNVLRHLIVNLEKDYAYKATQNPKKVAQSGKRKEIYQKITTKIEEEKERYIKSREQAPVRLTDIE